VQKHLLQLGHSHNVRIIKAKTKPIIDTKTNIVILRLWAINNATSHSGNIILAIRNNLNSSFFFSIRSSFSIAPD
jgi:hypothetical protein